MCLHDQDSLIFLFQILYLVVHLHLMHPATVLSIKFVSELADLENSDVSTVSYRAFSVSPLTIYVVPIQCYLRERDVIQGDTIMMMTTKMMKVCMNSVF